MGRLTVTRKAEHMLLPSVSDLFCTDIVSLYGGRCLYSFPSGLCYVYHVFHLMYQTGN